MSHRKNILLALLTGILFGISFPPNEYGIISSIALVPLLISLENVSGFKTKLRYLYFSFFVATVIALYWVGGFTHHKDIYLMISALMLFFWQPFVFVLPFGIFLLIKKYFNPKISYYLFPSIWILFEWLYSYTEFSFPWMLLGNTLSYELNKIQFIEYTGIFGLSFWLASLNIIIFLFFKNYKDSSFSNKIIKLLTIIILFLIPNFLSQNFIPNKSKPVKILINQPNIDPWEKWNNSEKFNKSLKFFENLNFNDSIDILILPETAFTFDLLENNEFKTITKNILKINNIYLLSGFINYDLVSKENSTITSTFYPSINKYLNSYNSIVFIDPFNETEKIYNKSKLVPFAERIPFVENFSFLIKPLAWSVGISSWEKGSDTTIFEFKNSKFSSLICFESIFPEYVSKFVLKGSNFIFFVTNDSWYDNSNGPIQHNQFAIFRAIENRRWIARCANGGISSIISPTGEIISKTKMFEKTSLIGNIYEENNLTFYTKHGDWFVYYSNLILFISIILLTFKKIFYDRS